jgi:hypothetical protein
MRVIQFSESDYQALLNTLVLLPYKDAAPILQGLEERKKVVDIQDSPANADKKESPKTEAAPAAQSPEEVL